MDFFLGETRVEAMGQTRVEEKEAVESRKSGDGEGQGGTEEVGNPFVWYHLWSAAFYGVGEWIRAKSRWKCTREDAAAWFIEKTPGYQIEAYEEEELKLQNEDGFDKKPAWIDKEEAETKVDITKVSHLRKLRSKE